MSDIVNYVHYLLDPMEDSRLTNEHIDWEVWHYIYALDFSTYPQVQGLAMTDVRPGYDAGKTPRCVMNEVWSTAMMQEIDSYPDIGKYVNNHADEPMKFNQYYRPGCQLMVGKDAEGTWVLQFWLSGVCYAFMRFDKRSPPPTGYRT